MGLGLRLRIATVRFSVRVTNGVSVTVGFSDRVWVRVGVWVREGQGYG